MNLNLLILAKRPLARILKLSVVRYFIISGCLLLAAFFIFDHLGERAFWGDEADVANIISTPFLKLFREAVIDGHPPFYIYLIKVWSLIFGDSEFALRSFSAFFALALVVFINPVANFIFKSRSAGLWAAFLASTNYFLIFWATQNKVYTLAALIGLAGYYFFFKLIHDPERNNYFLYVLFMSLGAYTHPWLVLIFLSQVSALFVFRKKIKSFFKILIAQLVVGFFSLPGILIILYQGKIGASAWVEKVSFSVIFESFKYLGFDYIWVHLVLALVALFFVFAGKNKKDVNGAEKDLSINPAIIIGFFYLLFTPFFAIVLSQFKPAFVIGRYEMVVWPAFILFLAGLYSKFKSRQIVLSAIFFLIILCYNNVLQDKKMVRGFQSSDETIAIELLRNLKNNDIIIATDLNWSSFYYYLSRFNKIENKKFNLISFPAEIARHPGWIDHQRLTKEKLIYEKEAERLVGLLKTEKADENRIWVLYRQDSLVNEILYNRLNENFKLESADKPSLPHGPTWLDSLLIYR